MLKATNGTSASIWMTSAAVPEFSPLAGELKADVCVIGAGIAGLTTAYLLSREGRQVVLIDALGIGAGETGRTTAHFFPPDEWYVDVENGFGADKARLVADSFTKATDLVESIVQQEQIDCGFERLDGYLYALPGNGFKELGKEYEAARRAGVDVELLERVPGLSFDTGPLRPVPAPSAIPPLEIPEQPGEFLRSPWQKNLLRDARPGHGWRQRYAEDPYLRREHRGKGHRRCNQYAVQ